METTMRSVLMVLGLSAALGFTIAVFAGDCSVSTTEKGMWCEKCDKVLDKDKIDKDGMCKECKVKVKEIELCVKKVWACVCGGSVDKCCGKCPRYHDKAGDCCGKKTKETTNRARVQYVCSGCDAKSYWKDQVKHDESKKDDKKEIKKTCTESGKKPHDH